MNEKYHFLNENIIKNPAELFLGLDDFQKFFITSQKETLQTFIENFNDKKIFIFRGEENRGKSCFKTFIQRVLNESIYIFEYNCDKITSLDDIFIAINRFINNPKLKLDNDLKSKTSIDEKIVTFFKRNTHNIVLVIDNFEYLLNEAGKFEETGIKNFFQLINSLNTTKLIFLTRNCTNNILETSEGEEITLRTFPLEEENISDYFNKQNIDFPAYNLSEFQNAIEGKAFLFNFAIRASKILNLPLQELFKECQLNKCNFQEFLLKKLYNILPDEAKKILFYITAFRCTINKSVIKAIDNFPNIENSLKALQASLFLEDREELQIRKFVERFINNILSEKEKNTLHNRISQFYSEQIPLAPDERLLNLSRITMHNESFFHQNAIKKQNKGLLNNFSFKKQLTQTDIDRIKYMASISQYVPILNVDKEQIKEDTKEEEKTNNNKSEIKLDIDLPADIELTDEEKLLLKEEYSSSKQNEEKEIQQQELSIQQEPFTKQNKIADTDTDTKTKSDKTDETQQETINETELENQKALQLYYKGIDLLNNNDFQNCIGYFRSALGLMNKTDINNLNRIILGLARALSENFNFEEAKEYLNRIIYSDVELQPELKIEALIELAAIKDYERNLNEAISLYNEAIEIAQKNRLNNVISNIYFKKALCYDDNNDINKAEYNYIRAIENAAEKDEETFMASAYSNLALIKKEKNEIKEAEELFKKSLALDNKYKNYEGLAHDYTNLGNLFEQANKYNSAIKTYIMATKAAKKTQDNYLIASCYLELGDCFLSHRDYKNSLKAYILSKNNIDETISTDSRNKIERRFKIIFDEIGEAAYNFLLKELNLS